MAAAAADQRERESKHSSGSQNDDLSHTRFLPQAVARKARIMDVVYNSSNNELVRTQTLVKNAIVQVDATPFKAWYQQHYGYELGLKGKEEPKKVDEMKVSRMQALCVCGELAVPFSCTSTPCNTIAWPCPCLHAACMASSMWDQYSLCSSTCGLNL
jgi:ribosomal protein S8E